MVAERSTPSARVKALSSTKTPVEATHPNTFHHLQDSDTECGTDDAALSAKCTRDVLSSAGSQQLTYLMTTLSVSIPRT